MTFRKKLIITVGVVLAAALIYGLGALSAGSYGSKDDPLVALSYLDTTVKPEILAAADEHIAAESAKLAKDFAEKAGASGTNVGDVSEVDDFKIVSLTSGQTLTCAVGTEIMLRIGSAVSAGPDAPRLIDETTGTDVTAAGTALTKNHMYMVTIKDNGIKSTGNTKVLVRGSYTIG